MHRLKHAVIFTALAALGGCAFFQDPGGALLQAGAGFADGFVTPAIHAPIANTALAAENLYSGTQEVLTADLKNRVITKAQGAALDPYLDNVYAAVVALRPIQHGGDATALLAAFNESFGKLFSAAQGVGVTLPTSTDPAAKGTP